MWAIPTIIFLIALFIVLNTFIIVQEREAVVKERLGKFQGVLRPGFHFMVPFADRAAYRQEMREQVFDVPPQSCITKDNIQVEVDGLVYLKVMDAEKASYGIEDYRRASVNLAQTTMRSEIGKMDLAHTFSERETINEKIVREIDVASDPWGIKVLRYEIRNITPSRHVIDTLEKKMEAVRQKRADITLSNADKEARSIRSEGERQEAINFSEGARQKRINEATGRAEAISLVAEASAEAIRKVAGSINQPGGTEAVRMQIVDEFIDQFGKIVNRANVTVVPTELANIQGFFEGMSRVSDRMSGPRKA